jgi:hypothetical protein
LQQDDGIAFIAPGGSLTVTGTLDVNNGVFSDEGTVQVNGTFQQDGGIAFVAAGHTLGVTGTLQHNNGLLSTPGTVQVVGPFDHLGGLTYVSGSLMVTDSLLLYAGALVLDNGSVQATQGLQIQPGAVVAGRGYIVANVTNAGAIDVGTTSIVIFGNYTQTSTGVLLSQIAGTDPDGFGQLLVSGQATLAGTLQVSTVNGYLVNPGDTFSILSYGSRSGTFDLDLTAVETASGCLLDPRYDDPLDTFTLYGVPA